MGDSVPVLVAEADDIRDACIAILSRAGFRCLPARTAAAGLRHARTFKFPVAVIDLALPTCQDGLRLAAELRRLGSSPTLIALSDGRHQAATFICAKQVAKPVVEVELLTAVRGLIAADPAA